MKNLKRNVIHYYRYFSGEVTRWLKNMDNVICVPMLFKNKDTIDFERACETLYGYLLPLDTTATRLDWVWDGRASELVTDQPLLFRDHTTVWDLNWPNLILLSLSCQSEDYSYLFTLNLKSEVLRTSGGPSPRYIHKPQGDGLSSMYPWPLPVLAPVSNTNSSNPGVYFLRTEVPDFRLWILKKNTLNLCLTLDGRTCYRVTRTEQFFRRGLWTIVKSNYSRGPDRSSF